MQKRRRQPNAEAAVLRTVYFQLGPIIFLGSTISSSSSAVTRPDRIASSRRGVEPLACAALAMRAR
jgi:hypothetical protein